MTVGEILEDLLINKLDFRKTLPIWFEDMVKYGGAFDNADTDDNIGEEYKK